VAKLHSFDVFDTALIRRVAFPSDVFRLIGWRIARELERGADEHYVEAFVTARLWAEREWLQKAEECTLEQIWQAVRQKLPDLPSACGLEYELEAERGILAPNAVVANLISQLRGEGARIVFISDTYLPSEFVRGELLRYGLAAENDGLYVSSELGITKRSGSLFRETLKREGVSAADVCHYGDNATSDVEIPVGLGISSTHLTHAQLNLWEHATLTNRSRAREASSLVAGSMRAFRLSEPMSPGKPFQALVATFLGPLLFVWCAWLLQAAQRDGIRRLFFAARDAHLAWRAAQILAPWFGNIDCRYLKASRQSVLLSSANEIGPLGMPWLQRPGEPARLDGLVQKLGIDWPDVVEYFASVADGQGGSKVLATLAEWDRFWEIVRSSPIKEHIEKVIETRKPKAVAYLRREGLLDSEPAGLVDTGWHLMVQAGLQRLVGGVQRPNALRGYYLGLRLNRMPPAVAGTAIALFYADAPDQQSGFGSSGVFQRLNLLEHVLGLAPHGTVRGYSDAGVPICAPVSSTHEETVRTVGTAVEQFCIQNVRWAKDCSDVDVAREIIDALIKSWFAVPNRNALDVFEQVNVSDDSNNLDARPMLQAWGTFDAAKLIIPRRWHSTLKMAVRHPPWPEAALLKTHRGIAKFLQWRLKIRPPISMQ
jgi:FMN phosphatase YigB (HAD superfamily)